MILMIVLINNNNDPSQKDFGRCVPKSSPNSNSNSNTNTNTNTNSNINTNNNTNNRQKRAEVFSSDDPTRVRLVSVNLIAIEFKHL